MNKFNRRPLIFLLLVCSFNVDVESTQCYRQQCILDGTDWKCFFTKVDKLNCDDKDGDGDICYEDMADHSIRAGCYKEKDLEEPELAEIKKTGSARWDDEDSNNTVLYCNTELCNNVFKFPENYKVDKEYFEEQE